MEVSVVPTFDLPVSPGPAQSRPGIAAAAVAGLSFYTASYPAIFSSGAFPLPFNIVGTNPALGANTTTIPTVARAIEIRFSQHNAGWNKCPASGPKLPDLSECRLYRRPGRCWVHTIRRCVTTR